MNTEGTSSGTELEQAGFEQWKRRIQSDERAKCLQELRPWLRHDEYCGYNTAQPGTPIYVRERMCDCGLSALLGEEKAEEGGKK